MDRTRGFLEYTRRGPEYRSVEERRTDFRPVQLPTGETDARIQAARCMDCGTPFCHACGCPLGALIPELNARVYAGRWQEAWDLLVSVNPFPEFTAGVCPALCEAACVLGARDEPVTVRQLEGVIVEKAFSNGYVHPRPPRRRRNRRVAVVGSGPAGLAVADLLNRAGFHVVVFDRERKAGGILRYGIPDFKLDKSVLDRRLRILQQEGIAFELSVEVGRDLSFRYLRNRFDAVCLACGAREPRDLAVPGRDLAGIHFAMDFLARQNRLLGGEPVPPQPELDAAGKDVAILGGGDTGADCLGTALRQKARRVVQLEILPKPPLSRPAETPWPMWPTVLRESSSHKEGGERLWSVATKEFLGENRRVTGLRGVQVEWSPGPDGRPQYRELPETEFEVAAQLVLLALGFTGASRNLLAEESGLRRTPAGALWTDPRHMTSLDGVFAAGDASAGASLVVKAIADGRVTALSITDYLEHLPALRPQERDT